MEGKSISEKRLIIETGDLVTVNFHNSQNTLCRQAIVRHVPNSTGESWIFYDIENGKLHYVSEGCTVTLLEKSETNKTDIYQFVKEYGNKLTTSICDTLINIRESKYYNIKFIEDIEFSVFVKQPKVGKMAWERFFELRKEASKI